MLHRFLLFLSPGHCEEPDQSHSCAWNPDAPGKRCITGSCICFCKALAWINIFLFILK